VNKRELSYWRQAVWAALMGDDTACCPFMGLWYGALIDEGKN
jgi:hypothetical protein